MAEVNLDDFDAFKLKGSGITCYRQFKRGKPAEGKHSWQIAVPYKSQGGARFKYAATAAAAWVEADKWRKKGY